MLENFNGEKNIENVNTLKSNEIFFNSSVSIDNNTTRDSLEQNRFLQQKGSNKQKNKHISVLSLKICSIVILVAVIIFSFVACESSSDEGVDEGKQTDEYGYIEYKVDLAALSRYDYVDLFSGGLAQVRKDKKYGYINSKGEEVVACQYDDGLLFYNGFAWVKKDKQWGVIDTCGNTILPFEYYHVEYYSNNYLIKVEKYEIDGKKVGVMDYGGEEIVPLQYDGLYLSSSPSSYYNLIYVFKGEKRGCYNLWGELVIPVEYNYISEFENNLANAEKNGKCGCISIIAREVVEVIPFIYDDRINLKQLQECGFTRVHRNNKYGFLTTNGKEVVPCIYDLAEEYILFSNDGSVCDGSVKVARTDEYGYVRYGYVNMKGEEFIPCIYDDCILNKQEWIAIVSNSGKSCCFDIKNQKIISAQYSKIENFSDGLARVSNEESDYTFKFGYIDKDGNEIIPCQYDYAELDSTRGLIKVKKDGKYGYYNTNGNLVVDFIYEW